MTVEPTSSVTSQPAAHSLLNQLGLQLSPEFTEAFDGRGFDEEFILGGVRSGKSTFVYAKIVTDARFFQGMLPRKNGMPDEPFLVWIVGPTYQGAHKEMEYVVSAAGRLGMTKTASMPGDGAQRLELNCGTVVETRSAQHKERLASDAPHVIFVVEAGQVGPGVREQLQGRALENNAPIIYSGTLEDIENTPRFAWYEKTSKHWLDHKPGVPCEQCGLEDGGLKRAYSLPSWSNIAVFPGGENDPKIERLRRDLDEFTFDRMVRGIPSGVQHPAYPQLAHGESRLRNLPQGVGWARSAGGADYGNIHPSALVVVSLSEHQIQTASELAGNERNVAWVRECWWDGDAGVKTDLHGDTTRLRQNWQRLIRIYHTGMNWRVDPNERFMAGSWGVEPVQMGAGSRDNRIGRVKARLNGWTLYFDIDGPGVKGLYEEMQYVHYKVGRSGELILDRIGDDRTAALENAIDCLDGEMKKTFELPRVENPTWGKRKTA